MFPRSVDQILECLRIPPKCDLAERRHRQQSAKSIEGLLLKNAGLLFKVRLQPGLQGVKQLHIRVEKMLHDRRVLAKQTATLQIRSRNVIEIPSADFGSEVDVPRRLLDGFEPDALIFDELHRNLRNSPDDNVSAGNLRD